MKNFIKKTLLFSVILSVLVALYNINRDYYGVILGKMENQKTTSHLHCACTSPKESRKNDHILKQKQKLRLSAGKPERHLLEVAQQKCFLPDHVTRPSVSQAKIMLQDPVIRTGCMIALSYHEMLVESLSS